MNKFFFFSFTLLLAIPCGAGTISVKPDGSGDYPTIQAAIEAAVNGDEVVLSLGTYIGTGNRDIDFSGRSITIRSTDPQDPCVVAATIIDCQGDPCEPHRGFYFSRSEDANSVISGLTITNGYGPDEEISGEEASVGGAIYCYSSSPTLTNCTFSNNAALIGGGMHNYTSSRPTVTNCTFTGNSAGSGGGMCNLRFSNPKVTNCMFSGNSAQRYLGGGMYNYGSRPTVTNCTFRGNSANKGGGMYNVDSSPTVTKCAFSDNSAYWPGGGMRNFRSSPKVTDCMFTYNTAEKGGGMYNDESSNPTVTNCAFSGNSSAFSGGGMGNRDSSSPKVTNCIFSNNSADRGGGMDNYRSSSPKVTNCTFSNNSADKGGGMYNRYNSSPVVTNSILWGNISEEIYNYDESSNLIITYSDIQSGWEGIGNIDEDPRFVIPGYWDSNGTPSDANDDYWIDGDYHLLPDSPCINAGDPNYILNPNYPMDLDGNPRIVGGRIDMGAYEADYMKACLRVYPKVINRHSRQKRIMVWALLPEDVSKEQVEGDQLVLLYPGCIEAMDQYAFQNHRRGCLHTNIFALFDKSELMDALAINGRVKLQIVGKLKTRQYFYGTDTVWIKGRDR